MNRAGYFSLLSSISSLLSLSSSSSLALCSLLKAAPCDWRIDACLLACLPACLLVGTSTGSWTKRELPLASSLPALRTAPNERANQRARRESSILPFSPFLPFPSCLSPSRFPPALVPRVARRSPGTGPRKKNLEDSGYSDTRSKSHKSLEEIARYVGRGLPCALGERYGVF